jgi:two-component system sensor histidine kinase YesM
MSRKVLAVDYPSILGGENLTGKSPLKYFRRLMGFLGSINLSIQAKILLALCIVILLMSTTNVLFMVQVSNYSRQYDAIITNITTANSISSNVKTDIDTEMWKIVAGKIEFKDGKQYELINDTNAKVQWMMQNATSQRARIKLEGIQRIMQTITEDVDQMKQLSEQNSLASEKEAVLENIRFVTGVTEEVVQDYLIYEVQRTEQQYLEMRAGFNRWRYYYIALMVLAIGFSVLAAWGISRSIYAPIKKLHNVTTTLTKNDLQALVTSNNVDEITELGLSFNIMIGKIKDLLDAKVKEQEYLKKAELRALQAQINPHFLYNTLDTIIWMAEAKQTDRVIEIVSALSSFFRISLSKGRDWITIGEEIERTRSYLTIQKMRYRDIMDFTIEVDERTLNNTILKLILQPLVENALYHGIKNKRSGGTITVRAIQKSENEILLEVEDDGIGFTSEKLSQVQAELENDSSDIRLDAGFGIDNVNKRIKLYYGKQYGLSIRSEFRKGTCVTLLIPAKREEPTELVAPEKPSDVSKTLEVTAMGKFRF